MSLKFSKLPRPNLSLPQVNFSNVRQRLASYRMKPVSQTAHDIFQLSRGRTTQEWARFVIFLIFFVYFIGLVFVMALAYRPNSFSKTPPTTTLSRRDIIVNTAVTIYPLPAAVVNDSIISLREFYNQVSYLKHFNSKVPNSLSREITDEKSLRGRVLDNLVETSLINQEARQYKITVTNAEVDAAYNQALKENGGSDQVAKVLNDLYGMTPTEFRALIRNQLIKEKVTTNLLVQVDVSHILVADLTTANTVEARLKKGESFAAVAADVSDDATSKKSGGDLGWLGRQDLRDKIDPAFEQAAYALQIGQVSAPVKTKYGYHIIKLNSKRGLIDMSYNDWYKKIKSQAKIVRFIKS